MTLREIWISQVLPADYDAHMSAIGQAQANARLVQELFETAAVPRGSRVLIAGAGTGQIFEYLPPGFFDPYRLICTDISARLLERLRERVACETTVDDVESSSLGPGFGAIIVVLLLEHVDYRRALASLARLGAESLILVVQENPPEMETAITPGRIVPASLHAPSESQPRLIPVPELREELARVGIQVRRRLDVPVADGKKMIGLLA